MTELRRQPLLVAILGLSSEHLQLTLPMLLNISIRGSYVFLLSLYLYSAQHAEMQINFYNGYTKRNFDINVTHAISQIYRRYSLDEFE